MEVGVGEKGAFPSPLIPSHSAEISTFPTFTHAPRSLPPFLSIFFYCWEERKRLQEGGKTERSQSIPSFREF